jgi:Phage protein Gp19/Gp15/Gp42
MGVYVTVADIELEWNQQIPAEHEAHINWLIDKAEAVLATIPGLAARILAGTVTTQQLKFVLAAMVVRVLRNPEGKRSETAGDYSYELASGSSGQTGMFLTAEERRLLGFGGRANSIPYVDDALEYPIRSYRWWEPGPVWLP